jgi:16S rRNA (guanine(966)-N(2))-methyltransferase RsmD
MRVISGFLKSRQFKYDIKGTRPTMDKVKESLFAMIQNSIKDSICLDLFSGSGSLGIEAISNGASMVYFVDNNPYAIKIINENINMLNINDKSNVILNDYKKALEYFKNNSDLVYKNISKLINSLLI